MSSLLRSTKFVRYFTGAARTLILNSAKSAETNSFLTSKALSAANNLLLRDYATSTKKTETLEPLLHKLDTEVRRYGRIAKKDIDEVFDEIRAKRDITSSQSLLVIRCCGELVPEELPEQRTQLVQKIWNVLTERGIPMDISHYNALLRVYLENEHPFSPAQFLDDLEKKGLQPNRVTYQRLMWRYCQEGDMEGATKVLERMRELNMPVSEPVLNALVMGHAFHGDTDGAKAVLETMAGAGLQPSNRTYTLLACGYARKGDLEGLESVIKTSTDKDAYMTDKDILDIIEQLTYGGHGEKAPQIFHHLQKTQGYNQEAYNIILRLINKGHENVAKTVMKTMVKTETVEETMFKGAFFVKHLIKLNKAPDALVNTCRELMAEKLVPSAMYIATECALQHGKTELAQILFHELKKDGMEIRPHYYWPLLAQKGKEGDEEGIIQILRSMNSEGIQASSEGLRDYVIPYFLEKDTPQNVILKLQIANVPTIVAARNIMVELLNNGRTKDAADIALHYRPRGQYFMVSRPLLNALSRTRDIESFVNILHVISSSAPAPVEEESGNDDEPKDEAQINEISRVVRSAVKILNKSDAVESLLEALLAKGLRISTEIAQELQQYLGERMTSKISELLAQLTSPDLDHVPIEKPSREFAKTSADFERILEKVKSKGSNVNKLQKQLLNAYIDENKVDKVISYSKELEASNFELISQTLAQLFEFYCLHNKLDLAIEIKEKLEQKDPEFKLNKYKIVLLADALIHNGRFDEAIQVLKENKQGEGVENSSFRLNTKCWQMLNVVAEEKKIEEVKLLTKTIIEDNYTVPSTVILGPSIKVHLLNNDLDGALKEFENCCTKYRCTPWKGELMKALIMKEDAAKLQWLSDLSTQIHGEVNILHDLVLAFVECGRLRQARRILETPGLQTRKKRLEDACQRYVEEGQTQHLEGLLEATKDLSHFDRSHIIYHLLVTYCKANETDKALGLWTLLQEEDEVPSEQFLSYLGQHLKSKNRPVPFVIPKPANQQIQVQPKPEITNQQLKTITKPRAQPVTKKDITAKIEELVQSNQLSAAMDYVVKNIKDGVIPKPSVIKYLLKNLAIEGNVEKIQQLGNYINENMKKTLTYDDKLTLAIFKRGAGSQHIDGLYEAVQIAKTDEDIEIAIKKFPRSTALATAIEDSDLMAKCEKVTIVAASKGIKIPANLLWMEYLLADKTEDADRLWNKCLKDSQSIVFRRLLQESHVQNKPEVIEKLLQYLKTNSNVSAGSLGNVYSRLINLCLSNNDLDKAKDAYNRAIKDGVTAEGFNKNCVTRLEEALKASGEKLN